MKTMFIGILCAANSAFGQAAPAIMKAIVVHEYGPPGVARFEDAPVPAPKENEALVKVIAAMGVVVWPMIELEADDALASAAHLASKDKKIEKVAIWTPDKDLAQCVRGTRVVQIDGRRKTIRDAAGIPEKFGVSPQLIPDLLALVGDAADGYPGIAGIGARTAAQLLTATVRSRTSRQTFSANSAISPCFSRISRPCVPMRRFLRRSRRCVGAVRRRHSRHGQSRWNRRGFSSVAKRLRATHDEEVTSLRRKATARQASDPPRRIRRLANM